MSVLALAWPTLARAQATEPTTQQLLKRIEELEAKASKVDALEAEVQTLKSARDNAVPAAAPVVQAERYPRVQFNLLGDFTYHVSNGAGEFHSFGVGDLDPVVNAQLSEKGSMLGDFVIASNHGDFAFEIERAFLRYNVSDALNVTAGRFHTAIGYYNNTYHNGTYFQTTTERPTVYLFEDSEGILPVHSNGVSLDGDIPSGDWRLHYVAELMNGHEYSQTVNPFQIEDTNNFKAFNLALSARPEFLTHTTFGVSAYHDTLTPPSQPRTDQWIFSAYGVYKTPTFEWLNELVVTRHQTHRGSTHHAFAGYSQVSQKFGQLRPYLRLDWRTASADDAILALIDQNYSIWGPVAGLRYDFSPMMALKFEYQLTERRDEKSLDEFTTQWTFRF